MRTLRGLGFGLGLGACLVAGCHAHQVGSDRETMAAPPKDTPLKQAEVKSERPVRTTPGGMLDATAMHKIQDALGRHGEKAPRSGKLDEATQAALKSFQKKQDQPATGFPDFDTLHRLGLDARTIYLGGTARQDQKRD